MGAPTEPHRTPTWLTEGRRCRSVLLRSRTPTRCNSSATEPRTRSGTSRENSRAHTGWGLNSAKRFPRTPPPTFHTPTSHPNLNYSDSKPLITSEKPHRHTKQIRTPKTQRRAHTEPSRQPEPPPHPLLTLKTPHKPPLPFCRQETKPGFFTSTERLKKKPNTTQRSKQRLLLAALISRLWGAPARLRAN